MISLMDLRLDVRVVRDVGHDLLAVGAHPLLEVGDRVEVEVAGGDVGRRRAGCAARDSLVHLGPDQAEGLEALGRELHVLVPVVVHIELLALTGGVQDADADHRNPPRRESRVSRSAVYYGTARSRRRVGALDSDETP